MIATVDKAARTYSRLAEDPFAFCEMLGLGRDKLTWQQRLIPDAIASGNRFVAVKSGQGTGKTTLLAALGLWRTFRRYESETVMTSSSWNQARNQFLKEVTRLLATADPEISRMFNVLGDEVRVMGNPIWRMKIISPKQEHRTAVRGGGWHNPHLTILVDEASGVADSVFELLRGTLQNEDPVMIVSGNPHTRKCHMWNLFSLDAERPIWDRHTFNSEESPLVNQDNVRRMGEVWGRDSDRYRVLVLGEFPREDPTSAFAREDLDACTDNDLDAFSRHGTRKVMGIDLAYRGGAESVIAVRQGQALVELRRYSGKPPADVLRDAIGIQKERRWTDRECLYAPDCGGIGGGAVHVLHEAGKHVREFQFGGRAASSDRYMDAGTEAWFELAESIRRHEIAIPKKAQWLEDLFRQLMARGYEHTRKGQIKLWAKDEHTRKTGESSPDLADAVSMAFYPYSEASIRSVLIGDDVN